MAMGATLKPDDLAGVDYFVGEAWRTLGETTKARDAYQQAVALSPSGTHSLECAKSPRKDGWKMEHLGQLRTDWPLVSRQLHWVVGQFEGYGL